MGKNLLSFLSVFLIPHNELKIIVGNYTSSQEKNLFLGLILLYALSFGLITKSSITFASKKFWVFIPLMNNFPVYLIIFFLSEFDFNLYQEDKNYH